VDPVGELAAAGASLILNPSCSPWHADKARERRGMIARLAARHRVPIAFVNQVGGNDELIFDGGSFVADAAGACTGAAALRHRVRRRRPAAGRARPRARRGREPDRTAQLEEGLVLGIRDYFGKQGLPPGAVVGLSGGIDSAVTAHLAVAALGPEQVLGVAMPSPFSSSHSVEDALALGETSASRRASSPIEPIFAAYLECSARCSGPRPTTASPAEHPGADPRRDPDGGVERREAGSCSPPATRASSRSATARSTATRWADSRCSATSTSATSTRSRGAPTRSRADRIRARSIEKPPSAELSPDQLDIDDLPDYAVLDAILEQAIEGGLGAARSRRRRRDRKVVEQVVARARPQRVQAPPDAARAAHLDQGVREGAAAPDRARATGERRGSGTVVTATPSAPTARTFSARGPRGPSCTTYSTMSPSESAS
jgi:NH3-dependent NAD+ synthetase